VDSSATAISVNNLFGNWQARHPQHTELANTQFFDITSISVGQPNGFNAAPLSLKYLLSKLTALSSQHLGSFFMFWVKSISID
jgi:hypothetical protein